MRISRFCVTSVACAGIAFSCATLSAAVVQELSIEDLSVKADRIVLGTVLDVNSRWNTDHTLISSIVHIRPSAMLKGESRAIETIELLGGTVDGITLRLTDTPMFDAGDGVVLFINNEDKLVGSYQGAYFTDGRLVAAAEPAERSVSRSSTTFLRTFADDVAFALGNRPLDDAQLQMPGVGLPNAGRYTLAGYSWAYMERPMGEDLYINPNGTDWSLGPNEGFVSSEVILGALAWQYHVNANFRYSFGLPFTTTSEAVLDDKNVAFFCQSGTCGMDPATIATTYIWSEETNIIEFDIVFNDQNYNFWTSLLCIIPGYYDEYCPCPAGHYHMMSVAIHEFGHALGLAHSDDSTSMMAPDLEPCEQRAYILDFDGWVSEDDRQGAIAIYGPAVDYPFESEAPTIGDTFGASVSGAGDIDNDGIGEVLAGAPYFGSQDRGRVYLYSGATGRIVHVFKGEADYDRFGWSVTDGGDGFGDVIVGAPFASRLSGRVYVFSGLTGLVIHVFNGRINSTDRFGWSVAGNLDVNDDGYDDIVVGSPYGDNAQETNSGKVEVFSGRTGLRLAEFFGEKRYDLFGWSVASVGRINSDDNDDFIVGAPFNDDAGSKAGKAYIYSGRHLNLIYSIKGYQKGSRFGYRVAGLGRVDLEDGRGDFVVSSPYYDRDEDREEAGRIDVYSGRYGQRIYSKKGELAADRLGWAVANAGDYDGDGANDVIIGTPKHNSIGYKQGRAYVRSGLTGATLLQLDGENPGDQFGYTVGGLGDIDNDDRVDIIVSAPYFEDSGKTYIYRSTDPRDSRSDSARSGSDSIDLPLAGDLNSRESIERSRIRQLLNAWMDGGLLADLNDDGVVNDADFILIIQGQLP